MSTTLELVERASSLRLLPDVALKVQEVSRRQSAGVADLKRVIEADPVLAARMLKMANSAFYGRRGRISELGHALTMLGFMPALNLALALAIASRFHDFENAKPLTRQSIQVASAARLVTRYVGGQAEADAFTLGLLHHLGVLVLNVLEQDYHELTERHHTLDAALLEAEQERFGTDHAQLGYAILDQWGLPQWLAESVRDHHTPPTDIRASTLRVAEELAARFDLDTDVVIEQLSELPVTVECGLRESHLRRLVPEFKQRALMVENLI